MVIINGEKWACDRCIRGHRVSSCKHTDQKLTRIKPKGRPSTQCAHCREARKRSNLHSRCSCGQGPNCKCNTSSACTCSSKARSRAVPISVSPPPLPVPKNAIYEEPSVSVAQPDESFPYKTWYPHSTEQYGQVPPSLPSIPYGTDDAPANGYDYIPRSYLDYGAYPYPTNLTHYEESTQTASEDAYFSRVPITNFNSLNSLY